jgi:hypothetical protein
MAAVTCALLLPCVRQYRCVMLTETEWLHWAKEGGPGRQAQALLQRLDAVQL